MVDTHLMHYSFPFELHEAYDGALTIRAKIMAEMVDATNRVITDAIVECAKGAGVTDLYLLDRDYILSALREKLDRDKGCEYCRGDREGFTKYLPRYGTGRAFIPEGKQVIVVTGPQKTRFEIEAKHCPMCGRSLEVEHEV